ncbi:AMP-binding protein [Pigmentiphaga sp. GD03639]|uniref:AMP-binding protein n=1 Tax=Pigmentiphaga sp. GD03639 TaxID=2975354 RepID=UPI0024473F7B|nr:AMP-binding protein [Pigmentiphaga sp. GD03639]MDH2235435.1 AMP-binding protein [Pigmentiphaga sp. GD03639]
MKTPAIRCLEDIRAIESQPYAAFMPHHSVHEALEHAAATHAQRRALTFIESADPAVPAGSWTYAELLARVRRAARAFRRLAGDTQPRVAFLLPAIPAAYVTLWGAEAAGIACPVNYLLGEEHIADLLQHARVNVLVALGPHPELDIWSKVAGVRRRCPGLAHVVSVGRAQGASDLDELLAGEEGGPLDESYRRGPDDIAALFHTGGTTGRPKLARHTHRNQLHAAWGAACMYGASEADVTLNGFPLFHVAGSLVYGLSSLLAGGEVVLPTLLGMRNTAFVRRYWQFVQRERATLLAAVPTVMASLLDVPIGEADLSRVRCLLTGGSPLPTELADAFEQRTGVGVRNILGMTECAGVIAIEPVGMPRTAGAVGLPLPFTEVGIDPDGASPDGREGILRVRGPNVGPGYTDARNDAGVFGEDGWLVTGDVGHIDEAGRVFVTGRAKDLIIRSSHNIDPVVIEDALLGHPEVQMAAAVGAPDEYAGEIPVAYVALRQGSRLTAADLADFVRDRIPERPAVPKAIFVVDALPMTAIGKLYKPELRARAVRWTLQERLARGGLAARVTVDVSAQAKGCVAHFRADGDDAARVRALMAPFALAYRIDGPGAGEEGA